MPLSPPADRELLHRRDIELRGYRRTDGAFDVEARLTDTKTYAFTNVDRGRIEPGTPLHGMLARMTVDASLMILAFEAVTEHGPYRLCPTAAPNYSALAGLRIGPGFLKAAAERVGGTKGCTHLRELLQPMATVAFQTLVGQRPAPDPAAAPADPARRPALLNSCLAYAEDGPVVQRDWPHFYTGPG